MSDVYEPDTVDQFLGHVNGLADTLIGKLIKVTDARNFGLDQRAGYTFYVDKEDRYIIIHKHDNVILSYYGGFEYVPKHAITVIGDYVFYSAAEDGRVNNAFEYWESKQPTD